MGIRGGPEIDEALLHAFALTRSGGSGNDFEFEFGLDLILDGLDRRRAGG